MKRLQKTCFSIDLSPSTTLGRRVLFLLAATYLFGEAMDGAIDAARAEKVAATNQRYSEPEVKAAYLYNFAKFTEWPQLPDHAMVLCFIGKGPLRSTLAALDGKTVHNHPLRVHYPATVKESESCDIVFFRGDGRTTEKLIAELRARPILTVSDQEGFARAGGIIELTKERDKIRFLINLDAAKRAGLRLNPHLLKLARIIKGE